MRTELECPLRRGAWYLVRKLRTPEVIVDVLGERVIVPRSALEIASTPPLRWSIVPRPNDAERFPGVSEYAVCPNCRERVPLTTHPGMLQCRRCKEVRDIGWDEVYA